MNIIYVTAIVVITSVVLIKLYYAFFKRNSVVKEQAQKESVDAEDEKDLKTLEVPFQNTVDRDPLERPAISQKNTWLHPTDVFGKMEPGVVEGDKSKTAYEKKIKVIYLKDDIV